VDFELTAGQQAWRDEVRAFLAGHVTGELRDELAAMEAIGEGPLLREFRGQVAARGWYALNWPPEYGGLGKSALERHLLSYEFDYAGVPGPDLTVTSIAPMIMRHGTEQNKADFLPGIASGEITGFLPASICCQGWLLMVGPVRLATLTGSPGRASAPFAPSLGCGRAQKPRIRSRRSRHRRRGSALPGLTRQP